MEKEETPLRVFPHLRYEQERKENEKETKYRRYFPTFIS